MSGRRFATSLVVALAVSVTCSVMPVAASSPDSTVDEGLEACLGKNGKLAVLMLIDESKSLREFKDGASTKVGNDPNDSRVPALESVVRVLASAVESSELIASTSNKKLEVAIGISGFGDGYSERVPFQNLTTRTVEEVVSGLELQREKDSDLHTRYHTALQGALQSFEDFSTSPEVCRLLVWFSDGEHDDDNSPGFVSRERDQIQNLMCGDGGIVDTLRRGQVNIVAAGLNSDERKLGLMRLISQGGAGYFAPDTSGKPGRVSVSVDGCGSEPPNGRYALAESADEIIDKLFEVLETVPGIPNPDDTVDIPSSQADTCSRPADVCNAIEFQVDESIASFQILAERPSSSVEVILTTNEGQTYPVLSQGDSTVEDAPIRKNTVSTTPVTERKVFISVTRKKENAIDGTWRLEFLGEGAKLSRGTVNFVGVADINLLDSTGEKVVGELKVARFKAEDLGIRVTTKTSGSAIRALQLEFSSFEGVQSLAAVQDEADRGLFTVVGKEIEKALQGQKLRKLSSTDLRVQPLGDVQGLRFKNGAPVPINFGSQSFAVRVSNGAGLPSFVRTEGVLSYQGTPKQAISLVFVGPDSGEGLVEFGDAIEEADAKANLDLIPREPCVIPQQAEAVCVVELIPDQETFDQFRVALAVTYSGKDNLQEPIEGEVPLDVTMVLQPKASRGVLAAVYLLVIFLVVQALVRWLLAFLVSRFAPQVPIARRIRLDAVVDQSGAISVNPMHTNPSHNDEGFALENTDSVQSFSVFGYDFSVSVLRTFLRSTVAPLGQVNSPGKFVIGSRGYVRSKDQGDASTGQVSLTLRGQWVVGVKAEDVQRLVNGESSVNAEVVAFLEPYEQGVGIDRGQQISDLSFGLASSNLSAQLLEIVTSERERQSTEPEELTDSAVAQSVDDPFGGVTQGTGTDPFSAQAFGSSQGEAEAPKRRGRRTRRSKEQEQGEQASAPDTSNTTNEWDPFA